MDCLESLRSCLRFRARVSKGGLWEVSHLFKQESNRISERQAIISYLVQGMPFRLGALE